MIVSAVKRTLAPAALLLLAGCATYGSAPPPPPQGPYGEPAPYPYPGDEPSAPLPPPGNYPGGPYQPPSPGAYPGGPYQPQPPECPITASRDWTAWVNAMPGPGARGPALVVSGKVVTATGGYQVAFDRYMQIRKGQPPQAFVTLYVAPPQGGGRVAGVIDARGSLGMAAEPTGRQRRGALRRPDAGGNHQHPNGLLKLLD